MPASRYSTSCHQLPRERFSPSAHPGHCRMLRRTSAHHPQTGRAEVKNFAANGSTCWIGWLPIEATISFLGSARYVIEEGCSTTDRGSDVRGGHRECPRVVHRRLQVA